MKRIAIFALLIVVLLVGCAKQAEKSTTVEKQPEVSISEEVAPAETPPAPTPKEEQVQESLSRELLDLLTKADKNVQSFSYLAWDPDAQRYLNTYYIKGSKIKIELYEYEPYDIKKYFDTVYLDSSSKTATATCESKQRCISRDIDRTKEVIQVNYYDYAPEHTPYTWIKKVKQAEIVGPELYENSRATTKIRYKESDGSLVEMWIDDRYGLALKVTVEKDGKVRTYKYSDILINGVSDSDVTRAA